MRGKGKFEFKDDHIHLYFGNSKRAKHIVPAGDFPIMLVMILDGRSGWQLFHLPGNSMQKTEMPRSSSYLLVNISISLAGMLIPAGHQLWEIFSRNIQQGNFATLNGRFLPIPPTVKQLVHSMLSKRFTVASLGSLYINAKIHELFPLLLEQSAFQAEVGNDKELALVNRATHLMETSVGSKFTIGSLADSLDTNETTLKYAFKKIHNMTLYKYYQQVRMAKANQDLKEGKSVTEVAALAGYSSISHFTYAYGKIFGQPPTSMHRKP